MSSNIYHLPRTIKILTRLWAFKGLSILLILGLLLAALPPAAQAATGVLFAVPGGQTTGACDSWGNACELAYALRAAGDGSEIWVKTGTYLPGSSQDDAFILKRGVGIYGGFLGVETARDQANWYTHPTILSGDLAGNDLPDLSGMQENSRHVVIASSVDSSAEMNGFFIHSGNAQGTGKDGLGGAIQIFNASPTLSNLFLSGNYAARGAGIGCFGSSVPLLNSIQYQKNQALEGGGLDLEGGCVAVHTGAVFSANRASVGAAIYNNSANLILINASISGNTASMFGGGIGNNNGTLILGNSIIWNNHLLQGLDQIASLGDKLYAFQNIVQGGYTGSGNRDVNPLFAVDPTSGVDQTWGTADDTPGNLMLRYESPAIDTGNSTFLINPHIRDLRNWPRIIDHPRPDTQVGPLVDLGGYEAGIIFTRPGTTGRQDGSSWADAFPELRSAIAFTHPGDEIWAAAGTYQAGIDRTSTFKLKNDVAIYGGFAGTEVFRNERDLKSQVSILSGLVAAGARAYHVVTGVNVSPSAVLDGFTIQDGSADGAAAPDNQGGGIYLSNAGPALGNLTLTQNSAALGGGVYISGSQTVTLGNSVFKNNQAGSGGGLFLDSANLVMSQVDFQENHANNDGGGLYSLNASYQLKGGTFLRNTAVNGAGIANVGSSTPHLSNIYFYGNVATNGGGIYNLNGASPDVSNAIFAGNRAISAGAVYNKNLSVPALRNVTLVSNPGGAFYAETNEPGNEPLLVNVIAWDNTAQPIVILNSLPDIKYSLLEGGCPSQLSPSCVNVLSNDPQLIQKPSRGPDNIWGTADDNYGDLRLQAGSKAIDAGANSGVLAGITTDIIGRPRFIDDTNVADTGEGQAPIVDMGAYENRVAPSSTVILSISTEPSYAGEAVTVHFQISGNLGIATGIVEVTDGVVKCSAPADQGQCSLTFTTPGQKALVAHFLGDLIYDSSYSVAFTHQVIRIPSKVTLSLDPLEVAGTGQKVRASFVVSPAIATSYQPGGTVTVLSGGASCSASVTEGGCDLVFNTSGFYTITADYSGDTFFDGQSSNPIPYRILARVILPMISR